MWWSRRYYPGKMWHIVSDRGYLAEDGGWTRDISKAQWFDSEIEAERRCEYLREDRPYGRYWVE